MAFANSLIAAALIVVTILVALEHPAVASLDRTILLSVRAYLPDAAVPRIAELSALGSSIILSLVVLVVIAYLSLERYFASPVLIGVTYLGAEVLSMCYKLIVGRPRPDVVPHLLEVGTASFPSGHALVSAATYLTMGVLLSRISRDRITQRFCVLVAVGMTFVIGLSRICLGVHYPSDVIGGWLAGGLWACLMWRGARWLPARRDEEQG
jgi:undecaprenyl-diphosphatase